MLLGLVLHTIVYVKNPPHRGAFMPDAGWAHALIFIHAFRMPVFFVMAGFFAAMLIDRRGTFGLLRNRAVRILVPLLAGWVVLVPLTLSGFVFNGAAGNGDFTDGWAAVRKMPLWNGLYGATTIHLWFLYDLFVLYLVGVVFVSAVHCLPKSLRSAGGRLFEWLLHSRWRALWFSLPSVVPLAFMRWGMLETSATFVPDPLLLAYFGLFFGFGWLLYGRREILASFDRHAHTQVLAALVLAPINSIATMRGLTAWPDTDTNASMVAAASGALMVWLLVFGLTGLFQRHLTQRKWVVRYLVDASYWMYLIHMPLSIWIATLLSPLVGSSVATVIMVLGLLTLACLASYDLLVRNTVIGWILNGRRYPRGILMLNTFVSNSASKGRGGIPHSGPRADRRRAVRRSKSGRRRRR
jgi:fucose 4-O-acetylase-like acetyltransferase